MHVPASLTHELEQLLIVASKQKINPLDLDDLLAASIAENNLNPSSDFAIIYTFLDLYVDAINHDFKIVDDYGRLTLPGAFRLTRQLRQALIYPDKVKADRVVSAISGVVSSPE